MESIDSISFSQAAAKRTWGFMKEILSETWCYFSLAIQTPYQGLAYRFFQTCHQDMDLKLRVFITGGGCHGFKYDFDLVSETYPDDIQIVCKVEQQDIILAVDSISLEYLRGAEIDHQWDAEGERFLIRNLKAKSTCSCGSSFTLE